MRLFEIIICLIAIFFGLSPSRILKGKIRIWALILFVSIVCLHAVIEGIRWQMTILYIVPILVFFIPKFLQESNFTRYFLVIVLVFAFFPPILVPVFKIPSPSGKFAIGYFNWNSMDDSNRKDFFTNEDYRSIVVDFYYPIDKSKAKTQDISFLGLPNLTNEKTYIDNETSLAPLAKLIHLPAFFFDHFALVKLDAQTYKPIANGVGNLPLLIFTPGRGGFRNHNFVMVQELVSHGYIVACVDHPGTSAGVAVWNGFLRDEESELINVPLNNLMKGKINPIWDDKVTQYLASDISFLISKIISFKSEIIPEDQAKYNSFWGHIDTEKIGLFGVSLGGMTTAATCSLDDRLKACLMLDAYVPTTPLKNGIKQPLMFITRPAIDMLKEKWPKNIVELHQNTMRKIYDAKSEDAYFVNIEGAFHANFSDAYLYIFAPLGRALGFFGEGNPNEQSKYINQISLAFFDKYLKAKDAKINCDAIPTKYSIECKPSH